MFKKLLNGKFLFSNVFLPLVVLILYCVSFGFFISRVLPQGVNFVFVTRLWKVTLVLLAGVCVFYIVMVLLGKIKKEKIQISYSIHKIHVIELLLLLLPLTPILQYILNNQGILSAVDSIVVFIFFTFISGLFVFIIPMLLGNPSSTRIMMLIGLAFSFVINNMSLLTQQFSWYAKGSLKIQLVLLGGVYVVCWYLYTHKLKNLLYILITAVFIVNTSTQVLIKVISVDPSTKNMSENELMLAVANKKLSTTPNIYLLVYDSYVANETMLAHGIDNSLQEEYLRDQGFKLYPHTYSIGAKTVESMSRVLNASTRYYGDERRGVSGDGIVQRIVKVLGYKTYGIFTSDYMFLGIGSTYDVAIPKRSTSPSIHLISAILMGEFRFDLKFSAQPHADYVNTKQEIFESGSSKQVFIYMHTDLPSHSRISGTCEVNEEELYAERVKSANLEMQQDIQTIIGNDPGAIVIIAGDHGPYITKNCRTTGSSYDISEISRLDVQDRFGTFLAIRWPTEDFKKYDEITVLQDVFPAILAYLYGDASILQSKVDPITLNPSTVSGVSVDNGIIIGGVNDGEPLFLAVE